MSVEVLGATEFYAGVAEYMLRVDPTWEEEACEHRHAHQAKD